jgi:hypothetical protein
MDTGPDLHWFVAVLVFESSLRERPSDPSVDVQYRLIRAADATTAYMRSLALGKEDERAYENPYGETCVWTFKGLNDLQEVLADELGDGLEIYGYIESGRAEDYVVERDRLTAFFKGPIEEDNPPQQGDL